MAEEVKCAYSLHPNVGDFWGSNKNGSSSGSLQFSICSNESSKELVPLLSLRYDISLKVSDVCSAKEKKSALQNGDDV